MGTKENLSPKAAKRRMVADYTGTETEEFILRSEPEEDGSKNEARDAAETGKPQGSHKAAR